MTPEQQDRHKERTRRWRALNRTRHLEMQNLAARRRRAQRPSIPRTPEELAKHREYARRYRATKPEGQREASKRWYAKNTERVKEYSKGLKLKKAYGITLEHFHAMVEQQGGRCAICSEVMGTRKKDTHVDHCHATGRVRQILCNGCNNMLGRARDSAELLRRGAEYLERHRQPAAGLDFDLFTGA